MRVLSVIVSIVVLITAASCSDQSRNPAEKRTSPRVSSPNAVSPSPSETVSNALVWVAVESAKKIALVDLVQGRVVEEHSVPGNPHNLTVSEDGIVVATLQGAGKAVVVADGSVTAVDLGGSPHDAKPAPGIFVLANEEGRRIDLLSRTGERKDSIAVRSEPHDVAISPDGKEAWASLNGSSDLAILSLEGKTPPRYLTVGGRPHDLLFAPNGHLWMSDWGGSVRIISADGKLVGSVTGKEAHHLAFTPSEDRAEAWISDHGAKTVLVVSRETLNVLEALELSGAPHHLAFSSDGRLAAVADNDNGTLVVFDVATRKQLRAIPLGGSPHGVWVVGRK